MKGYFMSLFISWRAKAGFFVLAALLYVLLSGCAGLTTSPKDDRLLPRLENIAVLPMDRAVTHPGQDRMTCALSDTVFDISETSPAQADAMTLILFRLVEGDPRFHIVPEKQCIGFLNVFLQEDVKASQIKLIRAFGSELGADAVLYGKLFRFEERIGSRFSVERPASIAYTLHLIRVSDGAILWGAAFDETQRPLSENLFKISLYRKVGMRWLTAEEFAAYALNQNIEDLRKRLP